MISSYKMVKDYLKNLKIIHADIFNNDTVILLIKAENSSAVIIKYNNLDGRPSAMLIDTSCTYQSMLLKFMNNGAEVNQFGINMGYKNVLSHIVTAELSGSIILGY